jgi:hypothetical protein
LSKCGGQTEFYPFFADNKKLLVFDVIFPLLRCSATEQELMRSTPEEFINLALDTCDK